MSERSEYIEYCRKGMRNEYLGLVGMSIGVGAIIMIAAIALFHYTNFSGYMVAGIAVVFAIIYGLSIYGMASGTKEFWKPVNIHMYEDCHPSHGCDDDSCKSC